MSGFTDKHGSLAQTHLGNESPVLLYLVVVVMTTCQELPHLPAQSLGDAAAHESRQLPGTHRQVHVPESGGDMNVM